MTEQFYKKFKEGFEYFNYFEEIIKDLLEKQLYVPCLISTSNSYMPVKSLEYLKIIVDIASDGGFVDVNGECFYYAMPVDYELNFMAGDGGEK